MRRIYVAALFALLLVVAILPFNGRYAASAVSEGERLSMYSKPSVVKIFSGCFAAFYVQLSATSAKNYQVSTVGSGSGFFINPNGYIATNAHVTRPYHDGEEKMKDEAWEALFAEVAADNNIDPRRLTREQKVFIYQRSKMTGFQAIHHVLTPDGTFYTFEIKGYGAPAGEGENWKDVSIVKIEVKNAPVLLFGDSDKVNLQDHVTVIGYPGAANATQDPHMLDKKSELESSITDGKISARKATEGGAPILQISAPTTHGNSGGPVLNDAMEVIGLLTFRGNVVNGQEVQGFNFVVASNTAKEFLNGVSNELGPADRAYREGLEFYWNQQYKSAIAKFEDVKRLFPQHSEVDRLIQASQQAITEGKDKSGFSTGWLIVVVLVILFIIVAIIVIAVVIFLLMRRRGKSRPVAVGDMSSRPLPGPAPAMSRAESPKPAPAPYAPAPASGAPFSAPRAPSPYVLPTIDSGKAVDRSATIAISRDQDTAPMSYGSIQFVSGVLAGQRFVIKPEGTAIGRDSSLAQIVISDPRISKRHLWIGVRDGRVAITDEGSRNGTFVNDPKSARVTEAFLTPGDTVILGESDVARFEYQM